MHNLVYYNSFIKLMVSEKTKKIKIAIAASVIFTAVLFFASCSPPDAGLSPMPAIDMAKSTVVKTASDEPVAENPLNNISPIELSEAVEETIDHGSNTENNGIAAQSADDGTLYYISDGLNSMSDSGNHRKQLTEQNDMLYLSIYENYAYYISSDDYGIYRIDRLSPDQPQYLGVSGAYSLMIIGEHIYYQNAIGEAADNYVYRTDMDGGNPENLMIKASVFCSDGQTIYYANSEDGNKLYSLDTSTGLIDQLSNNQASQINVLGGKVYYINKTTKHLTELDIETGDSAILSDEEFANLNSNGELLILYSCSTYGLYTMVPGQEEMTLILTYNDINALNIVGDWIFFESFENTLEDEVFFLKTDGTELSRELPVTSMAKIIDFNAEEGIVYCDYVNYLTGEQALSEYINDYSVSERKAKEYLEENGGAYIQNVIDKVIELGINDFTSITLNINIDSSCSTEGYKADISVFTEIYQKDPNLILDQLYNVTTYNGSLVKLEQYYVPVS